NYYKKESKTLILPPLASEYYSNEVKKVGNKNRKIICYAGVPFRKGQELKNYSNLKDRIDITIELLDKAKKNNCDFIFNIYGFTKEEYLKVLPKQKVYLENLANNIFFHGMKDNSEVVKSLMRSDFSMLYRDVNRDTTAGFPTKVSESLNSGIPVITTKTSDLENYIVEGKNGFFLNMEDKILRQQQFERILNLDEEKVYLMKKYCNENRIFYYKRFENITKEFFNNFNIK
ncbi:glycosyltransferase, partial [Planococcus sp. APC 3906]|uniref:glycosyltransferase n=1 Tax=Planococcus sp. APC 3906 TaxID=3035194 RepID=UPI0025B4AC5E